MNGRIHKLNPAILYGYYRKGAFIKFLIYFFRLSPGPYRV